MKDIGAVLEKIRKGLKRVREIEYFEIHVERYKFILQKIINSVKNGGKILDVGCFPGQLTAALTELGFDVYGISSEFEKLNKPKTAQINIETQKWPYEKESFDLVLMTEIIEHLAGPPKIYLGEVKRVLKKNGKLLLTTPNVLKWQNVINLLWGKNIYFPIEQLDEGIYFRHSREYCLKELILILKSNGFKNVEGGAFVGYPPYRERNAGEKIGLRIVKYLNYYLQILSKNRRDTLWIEASRN